LCYNHRFLIFNNFLIDMYSKKYLIIVLFLLFSNFMFSQKSIYYENIIYKEGIKTVLFHKENVQFSYPIININDGEKLSLQLMITKILSIL